MARGDSWGAHLYAGGNRQTAGRVYQVRLGRRHRAIIELDGRSMAERAIEEFVVTEEPFYLAVGREVELFEAAQASRLPVMLKGPTGCGKTRFVEHMAWRLSRPLITVACHE